MNQPLRRLRDAAIYYPVLALFGGVGLTWSVVAAALFLVLPRSWGEPLGRAAICRLSQMFWFLLGLTGQARCEVAVVRRLARAPGLIIAPNHPSLVDAVLLLAHLPEAVCVAKPALWNNVILGGAVRLAGYLPGTDMGLLARHAAVALRAGRQLLFFPEGTRTRPENAPLNPLKGGLGLLAKTAPAPVKLLGVWCNRRVLGKGMSLWGAPEFPLHWAVVEGPLVPPPHEGGTRDFLALVESELRQLADFSESAPGRNQAVP